MPRRRKGNDLLLGVLVILGLIAVGIQRFFEAVGFVWPASIAVAALAGYVWYTIAAERRRTEEEAAQRAGRERALEARHQALSAKYGDPEVVERILSSRIWVGQTREQLVDSIGDPHDIDQKILKTKKKEVWKYGLKGGNRYAYRITLDNDVVIGWDEKA